MKKTIILSALSTLALMGCQSEEAKVTDISNAKAEDITNTKRALAQQLSESYTDIEPMLRRDITAEHINVPVSSFVEQTPYRLSVNNLYKPIHKFAHGKAFQNTQNSFSKFALQMKRC